MCVGTSWNNTEERRWVQKIHRILISFSLERSKLKGWIDNPRKIPGLEASHYILHTTEPHQWAIFQGTVLLYWEKGINIQRSLPGRRVIPSTSHFTRYMVPQQGLYTIVTLSPSHSQKIKSILSNWNLCQNNS